MRNPARKPAIFRFGNCAADNHLAGLIFVGVSAEFTEPAANQNSIISKILL